MQDNSLGKLGGTCSVLLGVSYFLIGVTYVFLPTGSRVVGVGDAAQYYPSFLAAPTPAMLLFWETALGGILGIAAVLAISETVRPANEGWVRWTSYMALFGFAVKALDSFRGLTLLPMRAAAWVAGDASTKAAIGATRLTLDYHGWFTFGAVGLWVLVVSLLTLREGGRPRTLAYFGIATAIAYWCVTAGFVLESVTLLSTGVGLASIAASVWYMWMGLSIQRPSL
jgi:hypothetical protein